MRRPEDIPYGISDFKRIRNEHRYYVDKTRFIARMERAGDFLFFVRPRRFGKSLFVNMLAAYYDIGEKANFAKYFGDLAIGKDPTENANRYQVLKLNFSHIGSSTEGLAAAFETYISSALDGFAAAYEDILGSAFVKDLEHKSATAKFNDIVIRLRHLNQNGLYLLIDEYDNFTNQMLRSEYSSEYRSVTHGEGFYRQWFKLFKDNCARIFMTGVSPITVDDLTSGFNIAKNISQNPNFNSMLGFNDEECEKLYADFKGVGLMSAEADEKAIVRSFKPWYDGYCFARDAIGRESVYNSDMVLYHLSTMVESGNEPENMVDANISTDYDKLQLIADIQRRIGANNVEDVLPLTEEIATEGEISFDLVPNFPAEKITEVANFRSLFFYYGILSMTGRREGMTQFSVPNECVRKQLFNYLRDTYRRVKYPDWIAWSHLASRFAYRGEWEPFLKRLAEDYANTTPTRGGIQGEIRIQGYMQAEFSHINFYNACPEMELKRGFCDFCLFPERAHFGDVEHSYLVELKYSKSDADEAEMTRLYDEAVEQLKHYRADPKVPSLAKGTVLHQIAFIFRGTALYRLEQLCEERM